MVGPANASMPGDLGRLGLAEDARGADHEARGDALAAPRSPSRQALRLLVEARADHPRVQADAVAHAVLVDAVLGVRLELVPGRVHARPVAALLEGELVAERGDVDRDARDRCSSARRPPTPSPSSSTTKSEKPAWSSLIAAPIPEKPAPITTTSWSTAISRGTHIFRSIANAFVVRRPRSAAQRTHDEPGECTTSPAADIVRR